MRKKVFLIISIFFIWPIIALATQNITSSSNEQQKTQAYREGKKAAEQSLKNQHMWQRGQGDPEMAKAYQEGEKLAHEMLSKQEEWENNK